MTRFKGWKIWLVPPLVWSIVLFFPVYFLWFCVQEGIRNEVHLDLIDDIKTGLKFKPWSPP